VPDVAFAESEALTLGIEEELLLVEPGAGTAFVARADELLGGGWSTVASPGGWFKAELLRGSVELNTAPSSSLAQLDVDLRALRAELLDRASQLDLRLAAIGMHPDARVDELLVTPTDAHRTIAALHERVGSLPQQVTHGIHVHVGMPNLDDAVRVMEALAGQAPLLIALSAHAPVVDGARSPWRSARVELLRRIPWAGTTPRFTGRAEYARVHALHQLENVGEQRFLWEVAPVPALGTVEVRSFDSQPDPALTLAYAALVQGIAAHVLAGGQLPRANGSLERHNRWSATEFGTRARFLVDGRDEPVDVADLVRDLLALVRPHLRDLGNEAWLGPLEAVLLAPPVDAAVAAFDAGGVAALLEHARVQA
jgi:carboxylate-amine ligase